MLVKEIAPARRGSHPRFLLDVGGVLYFTADDRTSGIELWRSDGTVSGTVLVQDIRPGKDDSFPYRLTEVDGALFFIADDGITGAELSSLEPLR